MLYFILFIAFLGLIFGLLLRKYTLEEIKQGRYYLFILSKLTLFFILIAVVYYSPISLASIIAFVIGFLSVYLIKRIYFYLGLTLFLSFLINNNLILIISSLIFIYGLTKGSYIAQNKEILNSFVLFMLPFLLYFFSQAFFYSHLISWLYAGALVKFLISKDL